MKMFKKLLAGAALVAAGFGSAQAITVGGVTWDQTSGLDFSAASVAIRQSIDPITGVVSGFGTINTLNGATGFCSGCELTFQFGGFTPIAPGLTPSPSGGTILYSGGFVNVFVDFSPEAFNSNALSMTTASTGDGLLWLSLAGHNSSGNGASFGGTVNLDAFGNLSSLSGGGLLDVTGGLAQSVLDTNQKNEGSDFTFSTSFTSFLVPLFDSVGTGNFNSKTATQVPEPSSIALLGLGLAGLGFAKRRKAAAK